LNKTLFIFFIFLTALVSCDNNDNKSASTWIGGEVVNPKSNYIVLSKNDSLLDTIYLNEKNFFLYEIKNATNGIYTFKHNENQRLFIETGDSLMLRVNTIDFDESLSFSSIGAERNNFLMELFLLNEKENKLMPDFYQLEPITFQKKTDSLKQLREEVYKEFLKNNKVSKEFKEIVNANIDYDSYSKREFYTSANSGTGYLNKLPKNFYNYRKKVDFGNEHLLSYYSYFRFLNRYFDNLSYDKYKNNDTTTRNSYIHNFNKLKIIDSLITNKNLKNKLLKNNMGRYLLNGENPEKTDQLVALFIKLDSNKEHQDEIKVLAEAAVKLSPGEHIPNVILVNIDNIAKDLHSIIHRPSVLYFWSMESIKHYRDIHTKAAELRSKYPEYDFIGINTDTHFKKWLEIVRNSSFKEEKEYQFDDMEEAENRLVINRINKAIIVNKKGVILEGNTNLFNKNIEELLLGYINK